MKRLSRNQLLSSAHKLFESLLNMNRRLDRSFFSLDTISLANKLLGQVMCRSISQESQSGINKKSETVIRARIVETEAYLGSNDTASMSFNGKRTPTNEAMYLEAGTAFVYMTYGMYHLINISSSEVGGAVLIRALEPLEGIDTMRLLRTRSKKSPSKSGSVRQIEMSQKYPPLKDLSSGPGKLCLALDITKDMNKEDLVVSNRLWLEEGIQVHDSEIETSQRIGLGVRAGEWASKEMRYFIRGNPFVSKVPSPKKSKQTRAVSTSEPKKKRRVAKKKLL